MSEILGLLPLNNAAIGVDADPAGPTLAAGGFDGAFAQATGVGRGGALQGVRWTARAMLLPDAFGEAGGAALGAGVMLAGQPALLASAEAGAEEGAVSAGAGDGGGLAGERALAGLTVPEGPATARLAVLAAWHRMGPPETLVAAPVADDNGAVLDDADGDLEGLAALVADDGDRTFVVPVLSVAVSFESVAAPSALADAPTPTALDSDAAGRAPERVLRAVVWAAASGAVAQLSDAGDARGVAIEALRGAAEVPAPIVGARNAADLAGSLVRCGATVVARADIEAAAADVDVDVGLKVEAVGGLAAPLVRGGDAPRVVAAAVAAVLARAGLDGAAADAAVGARIEGDPAVFETVSVGSAASARAGGGVEPGVLGGISTALGAVSAGPAAAPSPISGTGAALARNDAAESHVGTGLGPVRIVVEGSGEALRVTLTAPEAAVAALDAGRTALAAALQAQGMRLEMLAVRAEAGSAVAGPVLAGGDVANGGGREGFADAREGQGSGTGSGQGFAQGFGRGGADAGRAALLRGAADIGSAVRDGAVDKDFARRRRSADRFA